MIMLLVFVWNNFEKIAETANDGNRQFTYMDAAREPQTVCLSGVNDLAKIIITYQ